MSHSETQAGAPPLLSSPSIPPSPAPGSMAAAAATPYWRSFSLLTRSLSLGDLYEHDGFGGEQRMEDGHEMWNKKEGRGRGCLCPLFRRNTKIPAHCGTFQQVGRRPPESY